MSIKKYLPIVIVICGMVFLATGGVIYNKCHYIENSYLRDVLDWKIISDGDEETRARLITDLEIPSRTYNTGGRNANNLKSIEKFVNLEKIRLSGEMYNMDGLFELEHLETIELWWTNEKMLKKIEGLQHIKTLEVFLGNGPLSDEFRVDNLPSLKEVHVGGFKLKNLKFIENLENIEVIYIMDNMESLDGIEKLKNLKTIVMLGYNIENIDAILSNESIKEIIYDNDSNIIEYKDSLEEHGIKLVER